MTASRSRDPFVALPLDPLEGWALAGSGVFHRVAAGVIESRGGPGLLWYARRSFADFTLRRTPLTRGATPATLTPVADHRAQRRALAVVAAVVIAGCASTSVPARWNKAGATAADYDRDSRACAEEAATATAETSRPGRWYGELVDELRDLLGRVRTSQRDSDRDRVFVKCMETRGWRPAAP